MVMVGILCLSILSSVVNTVLLRMTGGLKGKRSSSGSSISGEAGREDQYVDGAARRELQQRGFGKMWFNRRR